MKGWFWNCWEEFCEFEFCDSFWLLKLFGIGFSIFLCLGDCEVLKSSKDWVWVEVKVKDWDGCRFDFLKE